jgi:hypothetical protein
MTGKTLGCSFCGNVFHALRSTSKNRKVLVVVTRVNHTNERCFSSLAWSDLKLDRYSNARRLLLADRHRWTRCVIARRKRVVP